MATAPNPKVNPDGSSSLSKPASSSASDSIATDKSAPSITPAPEQGAHSKDPVKPKAAGGDVERETGHKAVPAPSEFAAAVAGGKDRQTSAAPEPAATHPTKPKLDVTIPPQDSESVIDMEILSQILEMDEDETQEFSRSIVWNYFDQVATTFVDMDDALAAKDPAKLSSLGHFLKGSSAALGVERVKETCELVQQYGALRAPDSRSLSPEEALACISLLLDRVKLEYADAEKWLRKYYARNESKSG